LLGKVLRYDLYYYLIFTSNIFFFQCMFDNRSSMYKTNLIEKFKLLGEVLKYNLYYFLTHLFE